jgi:uncharacterized protein YdeI (YjbR/CyaY-like superfamily)
MNSKVNDFLSRAKKWQEEMEKLRMLLLECGLTEELKWGKPCYSHQKNNVVIIQPFKDYFALLFVKGSLLNDAYGLLVKPGENTQGGRQIRMTNIGELSEREDTLKTYVYEAIEVEKAGLKVDFSKNTELVFSEEFQNKLDEIPELKSAFESLTPGRQRAYNLYFSQAKQSKTRLTRIEKHIGNILDGKGLND